MDWESRSISWISNVKRDWYYLSFIFQVGHQQEVDLGLEKKVLITRALKPLLFGMFTPLLSNIYIAAPSRFSLTMFPVNHENNNSENFVSKNIYFTYLDRKIQKIENACKQAMLFYIY